MKVRRIGEASNPGPDAVPGQVNIMTINVTSFVLHEELLKDHPRSVIFFQEHNMKQGLAAAMKVRLRAEGWIMHAGPAQQDGPHVHAGVGCMYKQDVGAQALPRKIAAESLQTYYDQGRVAKYLLACGNQAMYVYVAYGYTCGHTKKPQADKTDRMLQAVMVDWEIEGKPRAMVLGDLNAEPEDLPGWHAMSGEQAWVDAGGMPCAKEEGGTPKGTCKAQGSTVYRRRDYAFLSPRAVGTLEAFSVDYQDAFPVHAPIHLSVRMGKRQITRSLKKYPP